MPQTYTAALIGCSRMGAFIDNEVPGDLPYSHAAGYEACSRTDLVACSDLREDVMAKTGKRYGVSPERQYADYRRLLEEVRPDIVSVATQPEHRPEIVIAAAESGVRAIYAEKAMAPSMADADAMVAAVEAKGAFFNLGTNRRWDTGYDAVVEVIDSGRLGKLRSVTCHRNGTLFNSASHTLDLLLRLHGDTPVEWVQAHLSNADELFDGDVLLEDPVGEGLFRFADGVMGYALNTGRGFDIEVVCENGAMSVREQDGVWELREPGATDHRGRQILVPGDFPSFEKASSTLRLIEDLVQALDTGQPTRGGVRAARQSTELIFAFIQSHLRDGARVVLPLTDSRVVLNRNRAPRQPRYTADS